MNALVLTKGCVAGDRLLLSLQNYVKAMIASYKYPHAITFVPDLPKTMTGKINRRVLRNQDYATQ